MNINMVNAIKFSQGMLVITALAHQPALAESLTSLNFDDGVISSTGGWNIGSISGGKMDIVTDRALTVGNSAGALRAYYPITTGAVYNWATFDLTKYNTREVYVEFDAKMPGATESIKFFKIFGQNKDGQYANTTFGISGDPGRKGSLTYIGFGDGTDTGNDVNNVINLNGEYPNWIGRSYGKASLYTVGRDFHYTQWGTGWHHFKIRAKFNTATYDYAAKKCISEVNDGAYSLEIDGVKYVEATGLYNRHCSNLPIEKINFFDWGDGSSSAFTVWLDNVKISTGGFSTASSALPSLPVPTVVSAPAPLTSVKITAQ